jgi:hypothetical protein
MITRGLSAQRRHSHPPIVARVQPRVSKGITDLLLTHLQPLSGAGPPRTRPRSCAPSPGSLAGPRVQQNCGPNFRKTGSRSLAELTRQITPRTKNDHAPPLKKSGKPS